MDITVLKCKTLPDFEMFKSMMLPEKLEAGIGTGFGTLSIYRSDENPVAVTPYGTVIRFCSRKIVVGAAKVNAVFEQRAREKKRLTGTIPTQEDAKVMRREIKEQLASETFPDSKDIYAVFLFGHMVVCSASAQVVSRVVHCVSVAGGEVGEPITPSYQKVHSIAQSEGIDDFKVGDVFTYAHQDGSVVSTVDTPPSQEEDLLARGYSITSFALVDDMASFMVSPTGAKYVAISKAAKTLLMQEWYEAPEMQAALLAAATVLSVLDTYLTICKDD